MVIRHSEQLSSEEEAKTWRDSTKLRSANKRDNETNSVVCASARWLWGGVVELAVGGVRLEDTPRSGQDVLWSLRLTPAIPKEHRTSAPGATDDFGKR
eukprot:30418-Amphidinium_carterae.1